MKNRLAIISLFILSLTTTLFYQSCGESHIKANNSENGGLQVVVTPDDETPGDDDSDDDDDDGDDDPLTDETFEIKLGRGDNILYIEGGGLSLNLRTARIYSKLYQTNLESIVYHPSGPALNPDLPASYCEGSALPHCAHIAEITCMGIGCHQPAQAVRCHWQKKLTREESTNYLNLINGLVFITRKVTPEDPSIADCNDPILQFNTSARSIPVSLADRACVSNGQYYAIQGGNAVELAMDTELDRVGALPELCNNFSTYAWNTTLWNYKATTGYTTALNRQFRELEYKNAAVKIRFKDAGSNKTFCNPAVFVNPAELTPFFPASGLLYDVMRTNSHLADGGSAQVTYQEPGETGDRQFFLDEISAQGNRGGAIIEETQAAAMKAAVEVLVNRAKTTLQSTTVECN